MKILSLSRHYSNNKICCFLFEFYFILAFFTLSYSSNIYIVFSFVFFPFIFKNEKRNIIIHVLYLIFILLIFLYALERGWHDAFRIYKTLIILLPFFIFNILKNEKYKLSFLFDTFIWINVLFIYIDFVLYYFTGNTILPVKFSDFMPRFGAFIEDSNFYSYLVIVYLFYKKSITGVYNKFILFSIVLSGSFSAIFASIVLFFLYPRIENKQSDLSYTKTRFRICAITITIFLGYCIFIIYANDIIDWISTLELNDLLKLKMVSMTHRFSAQYESLAQLFTTNKLFLGEGAGATIKTNDIGINLHNSYFQLFLESGALLTCVVFFILYRMAKQIRDLKFLLLFCTIFLLGNMLEVFYFPLLSFIYFFSFSNE